MRTLVLMCKRWREFERLTMADFVSVFQTNQWQMKRFQIYQPTLLAELGILHK